MKKFYKLATCAIGATLFSAAAMAATIDRSVSVTATITDPAGAFQVDAISGTWPVTPIAVSWNDQTNDFNSPSKTGFKIKSSNDVTVVLTSNAVLTEGRKEIPINVSIEASEPTKGTSVSNVTMIPATVYEKAKNATGDFTTYQLVLEPSTTNMKDANGVVIPGPNPTPAPGNYTASVDMIFESNI
ncbi:hypothetical protein [Pseudomonas turukhanskensis]|uniref:Fimbrial assembly protein n=1 Tax=Pseudomonas turukhanskensis TaxID=1806536 RepID=A0A9W6NGG5_9PSED|nr:hypothetical protein [Pseudomonas turukhanskensis]GLK89817.1 hypothetical protein GCM10017655_28790 [Pseudomonas turukhanskensis]